jgi:hypothetical protein
MSLAICVNPVPTIEQVRLSFESAKARYVTFQYVPQLPPRPLTPSVIAQRADTRMLDPLPLVKGFLEAKDRTANPVWLTRDHNWVMILKSMQRRKALPTGTGYFARYDMIENEYLWRSYRMEGVKLWTVMVNNGPSGLVRLFPLARP